MADDTDGVGETFDDSLRVALTIASQFGERISRLREQLARQREADAVQEARELQTRFDAERGAARAQLAVVNQPEWWTRVSVQDIAGVHETATIWRNDDETAAAAHDTIRREVSQRYGIDVDQPRADTAAVAEALRAAEHDRAQARDDQRIAGKDLTASQMLLAAAERRDLDSDGARATRREGSMAYDSSERREAFVRSLQGTGSEREIRGRVLADLGNAKHPREATAVPASRSSKPRKSGSMAIQQRDRGGLSR